MRKFAVVLAVAGVGIVARPGFAAPPACGTTINAGETLVLDGDITGCTGTGLIVNGGAKINLAAHRIECTGDPTIGLQLLGSGTKVYNGEIVGCTVGVSVEGEGGHSLSRLFVHEGQDVTVQVLSSGNKIANNVIVGRPASDAVPTNDLLVVEAGANKNTIKGNLFVDTSGDAIDIRGNGNKVTGNFTVNADDSGIDENDEQASGNSIKKNVTFRSGYSGIDLDGYASKATGNFVVNSGNYGIDIETPGSGPATGEKVSKNVVLDSAVADMDDQNPMCIPNVWTKNIFLTADDTCIQ